MERYGEFGPYREMEVELEYDNNGAKLVSNMSDTKKDKIEEKRKINYVPILCFFSSPNKPGIKLYDQSPTGPLADFIGTPGIEEENGVKTGTFIVPPQSAEDVMWDSSINIPNKGIVTKNHDGDVPVFTFIVSEEELESIRRQLKEKEQNENGMIRIVVRDIYGKEEELRFYQELYYSDAIKKEVDYFNKEKYKEYSNDKTEDTVINNTSNVDNNIKSTDDLNEYINDISKKENNFGNLFSKDTIENIKNTDSVDSIQNIKNTDSVDSIQNIFNNSLSQNNEKFEDINLNGYLNINTSNDQNEEVIKREDTLVNKNSESSSFDALKDTPDFPVYESAKEENLDKTKQLSKDELEELRNFFDNLSEENKQKLSNIDVNDFTPPTGFKL